MWWTLSLIMWSPWLHSSIVCCICLSLNHQGSVKSSKVQMISFVPHATSLVQSTNILGSYKPKLLPPSSPLPFVLQIPTRFQHDDTLKWTNKFSHPLVTRPSVDTIQLLSIHLHYKLISSYKDFQASAILVLSFIPTVSRNSSHTWSSEFLLFAWGFCVCLPWTPVHHAFHLDWHYVAHCHSSWGRGKGGHDCAIWDACLWSLHLRVHCSFHLPEFLLNSTSYPEYDSKE